MHIFSHVKKLLYDNYISIKNLPTRKYTFTIFLLKSGLLSISYPMLLNREPQTWKLKQSIYYLTVSVGQESGLNYMIPHKAV